MKTDSRIRTAAALGGAPRLCLSIKPGWDAGALYGSGPPSRNRRGSDFSSLKGYYYRTKADQPVNNKYRCDLDLRQPESFRAHRRARCHSFDESPQTFD